jgi:class 3 adenylate cyclase
MVARALGWLYRKLGSYYPKTLIFLQFQFSHVIVLGGIGLLSFYQPMSGANFWRLVVAAEALVLVENILAIKGVYRMLAPVRRWLKGERGHRETIDAWQTLVDMPAAFVRRRWVSPIFLTSLPWCAYAAFELDLPAYSVLILFAGAMVTLAYGLVLRFFALELILRPPLEDVAGHLPDGVALPPAGIPLRWKLLATLPLINIITGVAVAGISTRGEAQLSDLGFDVLVAVGFAFTFSLELTILLSRSIMRPIDELRDATRRVAHGDLGVRVPVLSTDEIGRLAQSFNSAVQGLQERERLREAFGSYVDPGIAEKVLREGAVLQGDEVEVSVMFLDIRDFTAFAERSSAEEVVTALNEFWECVVPIVQRHGGHANKFVGDGMLAVFGAPDRHRDHADRAVAASLEIARTVADGYSGPFSIGIAVNSGPVMAGTIGGGGRLEFTVIGDAVNTAARVEEVTRVTGDAVLITEATRCLLERDFGGWDERPAIGLKGKSEPVGMYAPPALAALRDEEVAAAAVGGAGEGPAAGDVVVGEGDGSGARPAVAPRARAS